jgi:hypothetical protein
MRTAHWCHRARAQAPTGEGRYGVNTNTYIVQEVYVCLRGGVGYHCIVQPVQGSEVPVRIRARAQAPTGEGRHGVCLKTTLYTGLQSVIVGGWVGVGWGWGGDV